MTPEELIQLLGLTTPNLEARIASIEKTYSADGLNIHGRFFYVPLRDSKPTIDELIGAAYARMVNFAIPRWRINKAMAAYNATGAVDAMVGLTQEARDLFIRTKAETSRSGELGEVLLFMLMEWVLSAPIVACKMYLKTSQQMPVHGTDGIHLGHADGGLVMYWGESKMHQTLSSALADILTSIGEQIADPARRSNEVRLVRANLNLDHLDLDARHALLKYFDPYEKESNELLESYACFAGFDSNTYEKVKDLPQADAVKKLAELYETKIDKVFPTIVAKIKEVGLEEFRFTYFLLPFPSVDDARARFQKKLGGA